MSTTSTQAVELPEGYESPQKFFEGISGQIDMFLNDVRVIGVQNTGAFPNERAHLILEDGTHADDLRNAETPQENAGGHVLTLVVKMVADPVKEETVIA